MLPSQCLCVSPQAPLQPARLFGVLRAAALLCGSALSCGVATCGVALLLLLLVTRTMAPAAAHFQRDLYFDYTTPDVVAVASFLFTGAAASEPPFVKARPRQRMCCSFTPVHHTWCRHALEPLAMRLQGHAGSRGRSAVLQPALSACSTSVLRSSLTCITQLQVQVVDSEQGRMARPRVLPPGQRVDVWLELDMPESNGDVFQVCAPQYRATQAAATTPGCLCVLCSLLQLCAVQPSDVAAWCSLCVGNMLRPCGTQLRREMLCPQALCRQSKSIINLTI